MLVCVIDGQCNVYVGHLNYLSLKPTGFQEDIIADFGNTCEIYRHFESSRRLCDDFS